MSILLNALNKAKQQDTELSEIDQLIETPLDEAELDEAEPSRFRFNFQQGLLALLALIAVLLLGILWVLVSDYVTQHNNQTHSPSPNETTPVIGEHQTAPRQKIDHNAYGVSEKSRRNDIPELANSPADNRHLNPSSGATIGHSDTATHASGFLEQYRPQRDIVAERNQSSHRPMATRPESKTNNAKPSLTHKAVVTQSLNTDLPLKQYQELTSVEQMMVNEVNIDAHVYSEDASQRFIFVDGELKQEGEQLINSWILESVLEDGVIINNGVLRVKIQP
jgi:hypothetical protein